METTAIALIVIIALLAIIIIFFLWDRIQGERRLKEQGEVLSRAVGERIEGTIRVFGEVQKGLGELTEGTRRIEEVGKNISSLQKMLAAPKFRGGIGELLLERLLADCGLPRNAYSVQYRFRNGQTVDAVVHIGENLVPVDSKFPLEDFERLVGAESEEEQKALRQQFVRTFKRHIDDITKYIQPDEKTFDFALMYIPAENVYYETILRGHAGEGDLYSYCLQRRVFPVSPYSFYAYLQAIVLGLKGLHIERTAHQILGQLRRIQGDLGDFQRDYDIIGGHIRNAANKYQEASIKLGRLGDKLQLAGETKVEPLPEVDISASEQA